MLKVIGQKVLDLIRTSDIAVRYGGEEFAILLPSTEAEGALSLAERISIAISESRFNGLGDLRVTVSTGVATYTGDNLAGANELVEIADQGMYSAKSLGKNRVVAVN